MDERLIPLTVPEVHRLLIRLIWTELPLLMLSCTGRCGGGDTNPGHCVAITNAGYHCFGNNMNRGNHNCHFLLRTVGNESS